MPHRFIHTMEDIEQQTGLSRHFLNRCNSKLATLLSPYRTYGENNRVLYDDSEMIIFDQIKGYKESGQNLTQIRETLEANLQDRSKTASETPQDSLQILQSKEGEGRRVLPVARPTWPVRPGIHRGNPQDAERASG